MSEPSAHVESLTIRPEPARWPALLRQNTSPQAQTFRREVGLPTDRPVIMTGHQPEFWHPGILAKYLAADAAAARTNSAVAWIVVDQDHRLGGQAVRYPVVLEPDRKVAAAAQFLTRDPQSGNELAARTAMLGVPHIREGMARIGRSFAAQAESTYSRQASAAVADLVRPLIHIHPTALFATDLCRTSVFRDLVARMTRDPESCCRAYNAAVARHPSARIRPLIADEIQDRYELPLWRLPPSKPRAHVYAEDLASIPPHELAPKALFMTGLLRLAACDLFIHGTGGGGGTDDHEGYDIITDEWLRDWLGAAPHAPVAIVTATRFLPLPIPDPPTPAAAARSVWLARSARHNPHIIRDGYFDDAKRRLVLQIAAAPHDQRAALYRQMHALLEDYRRTHSADLAQIDAQAADTRARLDSEPIVFDRTWPFPLYPDRVLTGLRDEILAVFASPAR